MNLLFIRRTKRQTKIINRIDLYGQKYIIVIVSVFRETVSKADSRNGTTAIIGRWIYYEESIKRLYLYVWGVGWTVVWV